MTKLAPARLQNLKQTLLRSKRPTSLAQQSWLTEFDCFFFFQGNQRDNKWCFARPGGIYIRVENFKCKCVCIAKNVSQNLKICNISRVPAELWNYLCPTYTYNNIILPYWTDPHSSNSWSFFERTSPCKLAFWWKISPVPVSVDLPRSSRSRWWNWYRSYREIPQR